MLDDLDYIARFDSDNALAVLAGQPKQLEFSDFVTPKLKPFENVVLTGMGGSALAGLLVRSWLEDQLQIPFVITRDYDLPAFVSSKTLVIASSYSGNTEETLAAFDDAKKQGAQVVAITSGGKLAAMAKQAKAPLLSIPDGYQPRMAVFFEVKMLASLLEANGVIKGALNQLKTTASFLGDGVVQYVPQTKTSDNNAKQLANDMMGKAVWVYGGPTLATAAYKWKININEMAKNVASNNEFAEFDHNEILGWTSHPVDKPFAVVQLRSSLDNDRIQKRFELSNKLLSGRMPKPVEVKAQGKTRIEQILWTVLLGDFAATYLAVLNGVNPTKVEVIEKLKKQLKQR